MVRILITINGVDISCLDENASSVLGGRGQILRLYQGQRLALCVTSLVVGLEEKSKKEKDVHRTRGGAVRCWSILGHLLREGGLLRGRAVAKQKLQERRSCLSLVVGHHTTTLRHFYKRQAAFRMLINAKKIIEACQRKTLHNLHLRDCDLSTNTDEFATGLSSNQEVRVDG